MGSGKGSWYSQYKGKYTWEDSGDESNSSALGVPDPCQGVSFYDSSTLGKWFEIKYPNGFVSKEQQTDIGPAPWTGRNIDVSAVAAERAGYSPHTFPTDAIIYWHKIDPPSEVINLTPKQQAIKYAALRKVPPVQEERKSWLETFFDLLKRFWKDTNTGVPEPLVERLVRAMKKRNFKIFTAPGEMNVIYVEGMSPEGIKNSNPPNEFNDARFVFTFVDGKPKLVGNWQATTEPGKYWTENPMNPKGAARIKFGQYTAWQVGMHHTHEALVQTGGPVTVYRDLNEDYKREGDKEDTGFFGINQHGGYNFPKDGLGRSSAGCLVGRMMKGHEEFMTLMKSDPRYKDNHSFVFTAAVIPASEVL